MKKQQRKIKRLVFKYLDKITSSAIKATNPYMKGMVSVDVLKEIIKRGRITDESGVIPKEFTTQLNKTLDTLLGLCSDNASKSGMIPAALLHSYMNVIKSSFNEGLSKA